MLGETLLVDGDMFLRNQAFIKKKIPLEIIDHLNLTQPHTQDYDTNFADILRIFSWAWLSSFVQIHATNCVKQLFEFIRLCLATFDWHTV